MSFICRIWTNVLLKNSLDVSSPVKDSITSPDSLSGATNIVFGPLEWGLSKP